VLALVASAVLFSTGGVAIKLSALDAPAIVAGRSILAAIALWLLLPRPQRRIHPAALLAAVPYAATMILFVTATRLTTAANAILLQSTAPLYLIVLAPWIVGEWPTRRDLGVVACMLAGMTLLMQGESPATTATAPAPAVGNLVAVTAGLAWALAVVGFRYLALAPPGGKLPGATLIAGNALAASLMLPAALPLPPLPWNEVAILLWLGLGQITLGYLCLGIGVARTSALTTALVLLVEPVLNPLWVYLLQGEQPGPTTLVGGTLILLAAAVQALASAPEPGAADAGPQRPPVAP